MSTAQPHKQIAYNVCMFSKKLCEYKETDLLLLSAIISKEIACNVKDSDTLEALGDFFTAIGSNLTLMVNQRTRCKEKSDNKKSDSN